MSVCHKSHYFCIQRIWVFLLFPDTFRIQRIWSFLLFIDTFRIQDIWSFLLFIDTTFQKVSRNSKTTKSLEIMTFQGVWSFLLFLDTFRIQGILSFLLFLDTFGKGWKVKKLYYKGYKV